MGTKFTKPEIRNAYGDLQVKEGNKGKLGFVCPEGKFSALMVLFELPGASGKSKYLIHNILFGSKGKDTNI